MPEELDPEWEYWEPDPEIAEVMAESAGAAGDDLLLLGIGQAARDGTAFGGVQISATPNGCRTRLGKEKPIRERAEKAARPRRKPGPPKLVLPPMVCARPGCGAVFVPGWRTDPKRFCSVACVVRPGRPRRTRPGTVAADPTGGAAR